MKDVFTLSIELQILLFTPLSEIKVEIGVVETINAYCSFANIIFANLRVEVFHFFVRDFGGAIIIVGFSSNLLQTHFSKRGS